MERYRIDYGKAISQANMIEDLSSDLSGEIINLENLHAQIKGEWYGPASEAFQKQLLTLINDIKTTKHNMAGISSAIKNVAERIQQEDEEANSSND